MSLSLTIRIALLTYLAGILYFYFKEPTDWIWFAIGGGLALINIFFAAFVVKFGMRSLKNKGLFLGLLLLKSVTFVAVVAVVLVLVKPKLLPFTLGVGVVIFGAIGAALFETRKYWMKQNDSEKLDRA
ncbi:MAG: hypothetical protein JWQ35_2635 [Bacteriovoracaceae bacterium]|nr:hypothetical protein [Bacteriovoracaceae bacterium]